MPDQLNERWRNGQYIIGGGLFLIFAVISGFAHWWLIVLGLLFLLLAAVAVQYFEARYQKQMDDYVTTLSHRVKKVGDEALMEMPLGIILYDDQYNVEWMNPFMSALGGGESLVHKSLNFISEALIPLLEEDPPAEEHIKIRERRYKVIPKPEERLLYFFDVTELEQLKERYENEQLVLGIIFLDNYEEVTQGMDDQIKSAVNNDLTNLIKDWGIENGIYLKRFSSDRFLAVFDQQTLHEIERTRFDILDHVRESRAKDNVPLTLSIGVGSGSADLIDLGQMAQSALDLALGRGGDQVAIKQASGKVNFYGGKTNPVEKRTRVRARVISQALSELIQESDQVFIMGHKFPDMDALGASIGIMKIAEANERSASIVVDADQFGSGVDKLIDKIKENEKLWSKFISPDDALDVATHNSLVVIVDTHKPSMAAESRLLNRADRAVVIDHHRRGEEFVKDPVLVYMEPYASSTAELVTELLEYQSAVFTLNVVEATALLAGIAVDTKNFTLRTGSRTFDAASYLRQRGADTVLVQKLLGENLERFSRKAELIQRAEIYRDHIAVAAGEEEELYDQVMLAQTADSLLAMDGIEASFVIANRHDEKVGISARSFGDINVQVIMENIDGGGHLTNAATQLSDITVEEAKERLLEIIDDYFEGGDDS